MNSVKGSDEHGRPANTNPPRISEVLNKSELQYFTARDDRRAWALILANWLVIFALFYLAWRWPNPLTMLVAIVFLGGRQLGLAVIMHECGHHTFFSQPGLNRIVGQWFAARPVLNDLQLFFSSHRIHHQAAGTREDPDLANYQHYPVSRASFRRKVIRDLSGQTGYKLLRQIISGALQGIHAERREQARPYVGMLLAQLALLLLVSVLLSPWVYLLWIGALMTSYMLIVRIRQIGEHGAVNDLFSPDPREHARTTIPNLIERATLAPNFVNYHLEHHFIPSVPCYKLKELHELLQHKGFYRHTTIFHGYRQVLASALLPAAS